MRKIFIDCGAHDGKTIAQFLRHEVIWEPDVAEYEIFAFEPLPRMREMMDKVENITFYPQAAWIENTKMAMTADVGEAGTIVKENHLFPHYLETNRMVVVEAIDFSSWIKNNFSKDDYIVIKMDIEGAEYAVLNKMIADGADQYIDRLLIEFHERMFNGTKDNHTKELRDYFGDKITAWA